MWLAGARDSKKSEELMSHSSRDAELLVARGSESLVRDRRTYLIVQTAVYHWSDGHFQPSDKNGHLLNDHKELFVLMCSYGMRPDKLSVPPPNSLGFFVIERKFLMSFKSGRQLRVEGLEPRMMLAADALNLAETCALSLHSENSEPGYIVGDANRDGAFDQLDIQSVLQAGKYVTGGPADWSEGNWNGDEVFDQKDLILALQSWPDRISMPRGFEPKGIELGQGHDFFVSAFSWSSLLAPRVELSHPLSPHAGSIYKGNLCSGEGETLVPPTGKPILGLSYDARTDYIYATGGEPNVGQGFMNQGVAIYNATSGELIDEVTIGDDLFLSNILVTESAVFATSTNRGDLFKMPLDEGGKLPSTPAFESIEMTGYEPADRPWLWGLAGAFDGKELVVIDGLNGSGVLYHVDTASGASTPIEIQGDQQLFELGDELYLSGRTLHIMQTFANSIAVVQLSDDLTKGTFVKNIACDECRSPHSLAGFGDSIYAASTNVLFDPEMAEEDRIFGDPATVQSDVVRVDK